MKFEKPKSKDIGTGVASVAGATLGFIAPNGIANAYAKVDDDALITDDQKKKKMHVNLALLVGGVALSLMTTGNDITATAVRSLGFGLAGGSAKGLITHFAKDNIKVEAGTLQGRLISGALGCPCESTSNYEYTDYERIEMPRALMMPSSNLGLEFAVDPLG